MPQLCWKRSKNNYGVLSSIKPFFPLYAIRLIIKAKATKCGFKQ